MTSKEINQAELKYMNMCGLNYRSSCAMQSFCPFLQKILNLKIIAAIEIFEFETRIANRNPVI